MSVEPLIRQGRAGALLGVGWMVVLAGACAGGMSGPLVPPAAQTVSAADVAGWVAPLQPRGLRLYRFRWLYRDETSSAGGRGSLRVAAPDSVRFDVVGPLGSGAAAAVVIGDSARWVDPKDAIEKLVPSYPLMWAMLALAQPPVPGARLTGLTDARATAWRSVVGADTIEIARLAGHLRAEVRREGVLVGRVDTELGPDGMPVKSRLVVPSRPAQLDITFTASNTAANFPADIWLGRQP